MYFHKSFWLFQFQFTQSTKTSDNLGICSSMLSENSLHPLNVVSEIEDNVVSTCQDIGLSQINDHQNDNGRILDLVWSNDPDYDACHVCINHLLRNKVHHKALTIEYICDNIDTISRSDEFHRDFKNADYKSINNELAIIDWDNLLKANEFNNCVDQFYSVINRTIERWVPLRK